MGLDGSRDGRLSGDCTATQIIPKGKSARNPYHIHPMWLFAVLVPNARDVKACHLEGNGKITVTIGSGKRDDGGFHKQSFSQQDTARLSDCPDLRHPELGEGSDAQPGKFDHRAAVHHDRQALRLGLA